MGKGLYPLELKMRIVEEYKTGVCGYKQLARKYGLTRDAVRQWVLNSKSIALKTEMGKNKKSDKKDLEYYKTKTLFFETYSKLLEEVVEEQEAKKNSCISRKSKR